MPEATPSQPPPPAPITPPPVNQPSSLPSSGSKTIIALLAIISGLLIIGLICFLVIYALTQPLPTASELQELSPPTTEEAPPTEPADDSEVILTPGNTLEEIEQDINTLEPSDLDADLHPLEQDLNQLQ